jgi:purine-binding chemotaxis protein CheW
MKTIAYTNNVTQVVTLGIDKDVFAVHVDNVREILDMRPITRMPNAPSYLVGMIDVRGDGVPVICLRRKLGLPETEPTEHTRILVLEFDAGQGKRPVGLITDRVFEVAQLADQEMEAPPEVGGRWRADYIQAIGRRNGAFVIVFDLARLFSTDDVMLQRPF